MSWHLKQNASGFEVKRRGVFWKQLGVFGKRINSFWYDRFFAWSCQILHFAWVAGEKGGGRTPATHYTLYDRELAYGDRSVCSIAVFHGDVPLRNGAYQRRMEYTTSRDIVFTPRESKLKLLIILSSRAYRRILVTPALCTLDSSLRSEWHYFLIVDLFFDTAPFLVPFSTVKESEISDYKAVKPAE